MPKIGISKRDIEMLPPGDWLYVVYDESLAGFGVRILSSGSKSHIVEYRLGSGGYGVRCVRLTLGAHGILTPEQARKLARNPLADA